VTSTFLFLLVSVLILPAVIPVYAFSLHDALPIYLASLVRDELQAPAGACLGDRRPRQPRRAQHVDHPHTGRLHPDLRSPEGCPRSEEHTSELQSRFDLVCRLLLEKTKT